MVNAPGNILKLILARSFCPIKVAFVPLSARYKFGNLLWKGTSD